MGSSPSAIDPDDVAEGLRRPGVCGLKPYHTYSAARPTWEAQVPDYLPEALMRVADEAGATVVLHLVRARGIADHSNQYWVRRYCEHYPRARVVLAHCARGFNPYHVLEGLPALAGLPNLWVDSSAVCNASALLTAFEVLGVERLLYGSDYPVSHLRGTNCSMGDTFLWLGEDTAPPPPAYAPDLVLPLVGGESLRALAAAAQHARLTEDQVERIFWGNAVELLGL